MASKEGTPQSCIATECRAHYARLQQQGHSDPVLRYWTGFRQILDYRLNRQAYCSQNSTSFNIYNTQLSSEPHFYVTYGNSYSSLRSIQAGVPQGSLLGPTLFSIYINDIPSVQNDPNMSISVYADDTNISVSVRQYRHSSPEVKRCCSPVKTVVPEVENKD
jgi:hypothetical protein